MTARDALREAQVILAVAAAQGTFNEAWQARVDRVLAVGNEDALVCACGHARLWHSHGGVGDCEHDGDCGCESFVVRDQGGNA